MNRTGGVVVLGTVGLLLGGCGSGSMNELFPGMASSNAGKATVQLQSEPAGAQAKTSLGSSCQTPCSLEVAANGEFSVTFSLDGYQAQTIQVKPTPPAGKTEPGAYPTVTLAPNPVIAQLEPVAPAPAKKKSKHPHVAAAKPRSSVAPPAPQGEPPSQSPSPSTQ
jgi:hypothetical protein